jgi:CubicO group peptidase (beta-lactamase class C family)
MRMHLPVIFCVLSCLTACGGSPAGDTETGESSDASSTDAPAPTSTSTSSEGGESTASGQGDDTAPTSSSGGSGSSGDTSDTSDTSDTGDEFIYPEPDWMPGDPADHGFDPAGLAAMAMVAEESDSNCLVVTQGGVLLGEWYWNDYGPDEDQGNVYSVTKSVTSALVGIAVEQGMLDIEAPVGFPEWAGTDSEAIKLRNLISNDSGRDWSFDKDYLALGLAPDQTQYAIDLGHQHPIGTWWEYNNAAIQTVERALSSAVGPVDAYAQAQLFGKIHMTATMGHDGDGNTLTYQGVSASCRDLARFGYLYLRGGRWAGGVQVVPADWIAESIVPSTPLNDAYGFMWWLNRPGHWILPSTPLRDEGDGKLVSDAPDEMFAAMGAFGQLIVVDPTTDSVWVRLGPTDLGDAAGVAKMHDLWTAFAAAQVP